MTAIPEGPNERERVLMRERDIAIRDCAEWVKRVEASQQQVERLQQANAGWAKDAARYAWLRRKIDPDTVAAVIEDDFNLRETQCRDVDAAIDAAIEGQPHE